VNQKTKKGPEKKKHEKDTDTRTEGQKQRGNQKEPLMGKESYQAVREGSGCTIRKNIHGGGGTQIKGRKV